MRKRTEYLQSTTEDERGEYKTSDEHAPFLFKDFTTFPNAVLRWIETNSPNVIIIMDTGGHVIYTSPNITDLLGYRPEELIDKPWEENITEEDAAYLKEHTNIYDLFHQTHTLPVINKDGEYVWCECSVKKIKENQDTSYFVAMLNDISFQKEAEEMLFRSEKMSIAGQLAAGIAHEIRNPLTSIKGFLQLLQRGVDYKEEYYRIMIDEIEKMETITSELLLISKPNTDNKAMESVEGMISDVATLLHPQVSMNDAQIVWDNEKSHIVYCDRSQIKQVLINLVKNASEAMTEGGDIEIKILEKGGELHIQVIDEGVGVPDDIIDKINEPFFTTKQNGTGLGLMIVKQILERHHGRLVVYPNQTKGSTFQITMPNKRNDISYS